MLLDLRFDSNGCMDKRIVNLGGVSFNEASPLFDHTARCATFDPFTEEAGLYLKDSSIGTALSASTDFTIYFKYKINKDSITTNCFPILSSKSDTESYETILLEITEHEYFTLYFSNLEYYTTKRVSYTFDNKWHTFTACKKDNTLYFFIDGEKQGKGNTCTINYLPVNEELFIGKFKDEYGTTYNYSSSSFDNLVITDYCVYTESFVPPTIFFTGLDTINNYYLQDESNAIRTVEKDTVLEIEKQIRYGTQYFNQNQLDYLPRKCHLTWKQKNDYWKNTEVEYTIKHSRTTTIIEVSGIEFEMTFYGNDNRYIQGNVYKLYKQNNLQQMFMLFLDKTFIPLSEIEIERSDNYTTLFFPNRNSEQNDPVQSLEIVTIPFRVIYEENVGEREDLTPLYAFTSEGKFDPAAATIFYYIDPDHAMTNSYGKAAISTIGIQEQYYESDTLDGDKSSNYRYMQYAWRYGKFEIKRKYGTSCLAYFMAWDHGWIKPGDTVILYKNTILIDPSRYRIVGYDLIEFYDYISFPFKDIDVFTMQIITDNSFDGWFFQDLTDTKMVTVTATEDDQQVFDIPIVTDNDGFTYRKFLIFRGSVCIENDNRYEIDEEANTLSFTNVNDFVPIGTSLLFVFIKTKMADRYGSLHVKPCFYYSETLRTTFSGTTHDGKRTYIQLPEVNEIEFTMTNCMLFIQNTFISPLRYVIEDNKIIMQEGDLIKSNKTAVIISLRIVNEIEDPLNKHTQIKKDEISKGRRFVLYELNIDKRYSITLDNFICFDQNGEYISDLVGRVLNLNIIKYLETTTPLSRNPRYLTCVYFNDSLQNKSNIIYPDNTTYLKDYIILKEVFYEMEPMFDEFIKRFNYHHSEDLQYGQNLANAVNYIATYNQNIIDNVYEKNSTCEIISINPNDFKNNMVQQIDGSYKVEIVVAPKHYKYHYEERRIYFINGIYALWNKNTEYIGGKIILHLYSTTVINPTDRIDMMRFYKLNNSLFALTNKATVSHHVNKTIPAKISAGIKFEKDLLLMNMQIVEYIHTDITCSMNIIRKGCTKVKNPFQKDNLVIFKITIPTWNEYDILDFKMYVPDIKQGTEFIPHPSSGTSDEEYEIYYKMDVANGVNKDISCKIDVPVVTL